MAERILVVDDDLTIRETVTEVLIRQGYAVTQAGTGQEAVDLARKGRFDLILLDLRLPDTDGLDVMRRVREFDDLALMVIMTAYPEVRTAISSLKAGAYDYLNKPFDLDDLKGLVQRALETQNLRTEVERLRACAKHAAPVEGLVGASAEFKAMLEATRRIAAASRTPVLIRGESGTGKERIAQTVHEFSARAAGPWIAVNCSAISEGLLESEMFGHEYPKMMPSALKPPANLTPAEIKAVVAYLQSLGGLEPTVSVTDEDVAAGNRKKGPVHQGRELMDQHACTGCHTVEGEGGEIGPNLTEVMTRREPRQVLAKIADPTIWTAEGFEAGIMPPGVEIPEGERHEIVAYLASLSGQSYSATGVESPWSHEGVRLGLVILVVNLGMLIALGLAGRAESVGGPE
jgi:DNA-binding response OmpR family regulator/mono/diheme cytochrome c family protein